MGVAPEELHPVVAHRHVVHRMYVLGDLVRVQPDPAGHLFDATGARTPESKKPVRVGAAVPIIPQDADGLPGNIDFFGENGFLHHFIYLLLMRELRIKLWLILTCHSRFRGNPEALLANHLPLDVHGLRRAWTPAFAGVTMERLEFRYLLTYQLRAARRRLHI
jgi:hypothetical protein